MKYIYTLLFSCLCLGMMHSQEAQGKAYYESKTHIPLNLEGRQISEEQKKRIQESMKKALEKTYVLSFNQSASLYKEEAKLQQPSGGRFGGFMSMAGFSSGGYYKDIKEGIYHDQRELFGKKFLIKDSLPKLQWKLENETRKIGNYQCYKATAVKAVNQLDYRSMRRRRGGNTQEEKDNTVKDTTKTRSIFGDVETPKEIVVTAWYTPEIPISHGPGEYWGLPGLILEVSADRTTILCAKIVMNPKEKEIIEAPAKGKKVNQKAYNTIMKDKMEEMREMYGGRNRGRGRRIGG